MRKVIIDTDPGLDDFMAICLASQVPSIELLGLTSVYGNVDLLQTTTNALHILDILKLSIPVATGAEEPLSVARDVDGAKIVHGDDGLGNLGLGKPKSQLSPLSAVEFIHQQAQRCEGELSLICLGPLTNLALTLKKYPAIVSKIKDVVIMGGAILTNGNATAAAEFNIRTDPHAADMVFCSGLNLTIVGLDVTHQIILDDLFFSKLSQGRRSFSKALSKSFEFYRAFYKKHVMVEGVFNHDPTAVAYAIEPSLFDVIKGPTRVLTEGIGIGATIMDRRVSPELTDAWHGVPTIQATVGVDKIKFLELMERFLF